MMRHRQSGFTLLEVMVALAIFAVVSAALIKNAAQTVNQTTLIQDRTFAYWIAENQLAEIRAQPRDPETFPSPGSDRVSLTMAGRNWDVLVDYEATANQDVRRIIVSVFYPDNPDDEIASLTGFLGRY